MRSQSITGPLILVGLGVLFLLNNLGHDIHFWSYLSDYWPFLLIGIGVIRLAEVLIQVSHGSPLQARPSSGGGLFWIVILCLFLAVWSASRDGIHIGRINAPGTVSILGSEYEYDVDVHNNTDGVTRLVLDNIDGGLTVHGGDGNEVHATGHRQVHPCPKQVG